jgi:hypothetical protein
MSARVRDAATTVTDATAVGGRPVRADDVRGAGGGRRAGPHKHHGDDPFGVVRVLDPDTPRGVPMWLSSRSGRGFWFGMPVVGLVAEHRVEDVAASSGEADEGGERGEEASFLNGT